jgi:hypothetical protein
MTKLNSIKKYVAWFAIWLSVIVSIWYAANSWSIWVLFEENTTDSNWSSTSHYRLDWKNIKDWTVTSNELAPNSVTNVKIANDSVWASELIETDNYTVASLTTNWSIQSGKNS